MPAKIRCRLPPNKVHRVGTSYTRKSLRSPFRTTCVDCGKWFLSAEGETLCGDCE